jgi:hypothetical protein
MENTTTDAQSFSFEGVHGVVRKSRGISYIYVLLLLMTKFFEVF